MATAGRRRGRRDNGLDATDWRAIEDLDPRVAGEVLDFLATQGIAAYVQPAVDVDPVTRSATLPSRPSDRLYVDRKQVKAAKDSLRGLLADYRVRPDPEEPRPGGHEPPAEARAAGETRPPGAPDPSGDPGPTADRPDWGEPPPAHSRELDATFAGIVADFDRPVDATAAPWPAAENLPGRGTGEQPAAGQARLDQPVDARDITEPSLLDALDTFGHELPDQEPPERFVPPPPPPLPRLSRQTVLGLLAIVTGLVLLIGRPNLLPLERTTTMLLGFAVILGGAVALILRLRPGTDPDEEGHRGDGAQV